MNEEPSTSTVEPPVRSNGIKDARLWRALTMVAVAAIGASLAFMTGAYNCRSVRFEREIVQQNLISVTERQRLLDFIEAKQQLRRRRADVYRTLAESRAHGSVGSRAVQRRKCRSFDVAGTRGIRCCACAEAVYRRHEPGSECRRADVDTNVRRSVDRFKEARGMAGEPDSLEKLDEAMEEAHEKVRTHAGAVVIFILSLVMFTLSDIYRAKPHLSKTWFAIGIVVALLGTALAGYVNPDLRVGRAASSPSCSRFLRGREHIVAVIRRATPRGTIEGQRESGDAATWRSRPTPKIRIPEMKPEMHPILGLFAQGAHAVFAATDHRFHGGTVLLSAVLGFRLHLGTDRIDHDRTSGIEAADRTEQRRYL